MPVKDKQIKKHYLEYLTDPLMEIKNVKVSTVVLNDNNLKQLESQIEKVKTPFIIILGGQDQMIDNKAAKNFFDKTKVQDKDIITYDDLDHMIL